MTEKGALPRAVIAITLFMWSQLGFATAGHERTTAYGINPTAGHYLQVGDAKLYYEVYGSGRPLVLIHGGLFGYIDESRV